MKDCEIIELYWQRNPYAIDETDKKYGATCQRIAYDILSNREDAEECVDDTYMATWKSLPPQRPTYLSAYLFRIVRNFSFTRIREMRAHKRGGGEMALLLDELEECVKAPNNVEKEYEAKELASAINIFLGLLPKDDRQIFVHRYWLTLSTKEIAHRLDFTESKVSSSLFRSRKKLHEYLVKEELI